MTDGEVEGKYRVTEIGGGGYRRRVVGCYTNLRDVRSLGGKGREEGSGREEGKRRLEELPLQLSVPEAEVRRVVRSRETEVVRYLWRGRFSVSPINGLVYVRKIRSIMV